MPLGETIHREIENRAEPHVLFTAIGQDYVVTGCVLTNILYPYAFIIFKRNSQFLFGTEVKQGIPFQLLNKIFLIKDDVLYAQLYNSIPKWEWNSPNYNEWNSNDDDWNSGGGLAGLAKLGVILTVSGI